MPTRITMAQVANKAGVSLMTVSRVINDKEGVSEATRARVQAIIEELGYRPSDIARGLATQRTGTLGLVMPDIANPFFSEIARGAEHVAYNAGYNIFLCNTEEDISRELDVLQSLEEKRVDGILVCSSRLEDCQLETALTNHPAVVLVNRRMENPKIKLGLTLIDDHGGGKLATQHLLNIGHQKIGFLAGPPTSQSGRWRADGYYETLITTGIQPTPTWIRHCTPTIEGGRQGTQELLNQHPELTGLFCYNDLVAIGALQSCAELGRKVPDNIAIIGFDDIPFAALTTPALTTCHVPRHKLGAEAMRLLLDRINGSSNESCIEITLPAKLIVRNST